MNFCTYLCVVTFIDTEYLKIKLAPYITDFIAATNSHLLAIVSAVSPFRLIDERQNFHHFTEKLQSVNSSSPENFPFVIKLKATGFSYN